MPIEFACQCGQQYKVKDHYAGRAIQCRSCSSNIEVPPADGVDLGIVTADVPSEPSAHQGGIPPIDRDWLVAAIAKGISVERQALRKQLRWSFGPEFVLALVGLFSLGMVGSGNPAAPICLVLAIVGLAICSKLNP
jgi:hypothetical protein